jgi:dephospho-CoA kinase
MIIIGVVGKLSAGKDAFALVRVEVKDPRVRFQRGVERDQPRDVDSYAECLENDKSETEWFDLDHTLDMADVVIANDGALEKFHQQFEDKIVAPLLYES